MKTAATHLPHRHLMVWSVIFFPLQSYAFLVQKNLSHGSNIINISRPSQWSSLFSDPTNENQDSSPKVPDEDDSRPPDIRMFLNQRSIQSFMFLLTQTRDPHTIKWLDDFTRPTTGPFGEGTKGYDEAAGLARSEENDETLPSTTVSSQASAQNDKKIKLEASLLPWHVRNERDCVPHLGRIFSSTSGGPRKGDNHRFGQGRVRHRHRTGENMQPNSERKKSNFQGMGERFARRSTNEKVDHAFVS
mmetsp:Transcript_15058/g.33594  ORF Transcript_15058/g.33594 Transcript_15058/m.33594 type:complete len:246 (+) Transcript_15058:52-789(+)